MGKNKTVDMKRIGGCSKVGRANSGTISIAASNDSSNEENDVSVQLMSASQIEPFVDMLLTPARDKTNQILMTWNSEPTNNSISMYRIWRILTPDNPENTTTIQRRNT